MKRNFSMRLLFVLFVLQSVSTFGSEMHWGIFEPFKKNLISDYTYLHQNPELGHQEKRAHRYIKKQLKPLKHIKIYRLASSPTAIIAHFNHPNGTRRIAFRSELDARPLNKGQVEPISHVPRSDIDGKMHNCGHDFHTAILLTYLRYLNANPEIQDHDVVAIFQPAEEVKGGPEEILSSGILDDLEVEAIYALHVAPGLPVGNISLTPGPFMAGSHYLTLELEGRSTHVATLTKENDLLLAASRTIERITDLNSTFNHPDQGSNRFNLVTTHIETDARSKNATPSNVSLFISLRHFIPLEAPITAAEHQSILSLINAALESALNDFHLDFKLSFNQGSPPLTNDITLFDQLQPRLKSQLKNILQVEDQRFLFAEDFAFYTHVFPTLYFGLGIQKNALGHNNVHQTNFNLHTDAGYYGLKLLLSLSQAHPI